MYGTPYLKYREFETFEDVSEFLVYRGIVNYSIFKKLEDKEEVEMIYRDNDIKYLKSIIKEVREYLNTEIKIGNVKKIQKKNKVEKLTRWFEDDELEDARYNTEVKIVNKINEIIDFINKGE